MAITGLRFIPQIKLTELIVKEVANLTNKINEFGQYLHQEGKDEKTIQAYIPIIIKLSQWYTNTTGEEFNPEDITALDLKDWVSYLKTNQKFSQATINKYINATRAYFNFLTEEYDLSVNPTTKLRSKRPSVMERTPRWLSRKEQAKLLHIISKEKKKQKQLRDYAIAQLMLQAGLRIDEVTDQELNDCDSKRGTVTIRNGKGGKMAVLPANRELLKAVAAYLEVRPDVKYSALFISQKKTPITTRGIEHQFRKYLDKAGLEDATIHCLRHSFCKNMLDTGVSLEVVSQLARHETLDTTRIYLTPSQYNLRQAVESISTE